ncbi:Hypothetical predicted protein [Octopus vulgaris]|uniref:Uncharacterized protein n=1 Tax=Octopus vulgaris TaxID=6645 RepID=A0AA36FIT4_OCTVU|nr:Hypothetical predicted protein [Octopus vulgaris]
MKYFLSICLLIVEYLGLDYCLREKYCPEAWKEYPRGDDEEDSDTFCGLSFKYHFWFTLIPRGVIGLLTCRGSKYKPGRPSQERHTANSYSIWRTRNQESRPYLDENKLANVRRDILRNNRLTESEISAIKHATEYDINIRHKGNEESDEQYSPPQDLIDRLPSDQSTQKLEDTRNSIEPVKDSQENDKTTVTEDLAFAKEHRESMAEMRQKILNTLEVMLVCIHAGTLNGQLKLRRNPNIHLRLVLHRLTAFYQFSFYRYWCEAIRSRLKNNVSILRLFIKI